jgi:predicted transcriptional regulator
MLERKGRAYKKGKSKRKSQAEKVLEIIQFYTKEEPQHGISTDRLVEKTGLKIHSLSARLSELEQDGKIYQKAKHDLDGTTYTVWSETPADLIGLRRAENWNKRMALWLGKGLKNGFITQKEFRVIDKQNTLF